MGPTRLGWVCGVAGLWGFGLACAGGSPPEPVSPTPAAPTAVTPAPASVAPPGWTAERVPAREILSGRDRQCGTAGASVVWRTDGSFLVERPDAKFGGTWQLVDGDIVYVTTGPMGPDQRCSSARFLLDAAGVPEVLLCAEGPLGCTAEVRWAVEVVAVGADPAAVDAAAALIGASDPSFGPGVVFPGEPNPPALGRARGVSVRYRGSEGPARRLAEDLGARLQVAVGAPVPVRADDAASSPVVVVVAPLDAP